LGKKHDGNASDPAALLNVSQRHAARGRTLLLGDRVTVAALDEAKVHDLLGLERAPGANIQD
jgi:hypothetical protein